MYAVVVQATRSTPSGTQLARYPSSRETIRQRSSRPGIRLPHVTRRCSTRARAGPLARRCPRWTLREVPRNLPRLVSSKARISPDTLVPQIDATDRSGRLVNFVESGRQNFREVRSVPVKRHQSKANARPKSKQQNNRESAGTVAQTGNLV